MLGSLLGGLLLAACVVSEEFDDAQFLCDPQGGDDECPSGMSCSADGLCRHGTAKPDAGTGGNDGGGDGCFPVTCASLAPQCGLLDDGCGNFQQCGCTLPDTCGGAGKTGECGCSRKQSRTGQPGAGFEEKPTGTVSWQKPELATASDDQWATATLTAGQSSALLKLAAFDFPNLPSDPQKVKITGVEISIERSAPGGAIKDQAVRLLIGGSPAPTVANKNIAWAATDTEAKYGGETDLWGATSLELDQIKDSQFGVSLSTTASVADSARVDGVKLTVFFEDLSCPVQ